MTCSGDGMCLGDHGNRKFPCQYNCQFVECSDCKEKVLPQWYTLHKHPLALCQKCLLKKRKCNICNKNIIGSIHLSHKKCKREAEEIAEFDEGEI